MKVISASDVTLSIGGVTIGTAAAVSRQRAIEIYGEEALEMDEWGHNASLPSWAHSFTGQVKLTTAAFRRLEAAMNPAMKDFHFWRRVKLAQERRRLARKRQGRHA